MAQINKAKNLLEDNIDKIVSTGLVEISSSAGTGGGVKQVDEYNYCIKFKDEEGYASGKNYEELVESIAETCEIPAEKVQICINLNDGKKAKRVKN